MSAWITFTTPLQAFWLEDGHLRIAADRARSANVRGAPDGRGAGAPGAGAESPPPPSRTTRRCMCRRRRAEVEVWLQVDEHGYISLSPPLAAYALMLGGVAVLIARLGIRREVKVRS